jgi:hypothetical protein
VVVTYGGQRSAAVLCHAASRRHSLADGRDEGEMNSASGRIAIVLYALVMAGVIVGLDLAFFRGRFWERLMVNIGIVLVFRALYLRFLRHP